MLIEERSFLFGENKKRKPLGFGNLISLAEPHLEKQELLNIFSCIIPKSRLSQKELWEGKFIHWTGSHLHVIVREAGGHSLHNLKRGREKKNSSLHPFKFLKLLLQVFRWGLMWRRGGGWHLLSSVRVPCSPP